MPAPSVSMLRLVPILARSVGFFPVAWPLAPRPKGAFVIAPSRACHSHPLPSTSPYSTSPARPLPPPPSPSNPVVLAAPRSPQLLEEAQALPFLVAVVHGGGGSHLSGQ